MLWTNPNPISASMYDLAWKPDAKEIAFISGHEDGYSPFHTDIYAIQPDGSGMRRISNPPTREFLLAGGYQIASIKGKIYNGRGNVSVFLVYVEGARDYVSVPLGAYQTETPFVINNIKYDPTNSHYVVFCWSDGGCANGREYSVPVFTLLPGQTTDVGTLQFNGSCFHPEVTDVTWKRDGSEVGAIFEIMGYKFDADGQVAGSSLFTSNAVADDLAWSPVDDSILYVDVVSKHGLYRTYSGGGTGDLLITSGVISPEDPCWLPDGSGFVYVMNNHIYEYSMSSATSQVVKFFYNEIISHPGVSPDGNYISFTRGNSINNNTDLWILNHTNLTEMWAVTTNGRASYASWSLVDPVTQPDEDGDGIPDWWETQYFGGATNAIANADQDNDGESNLAEYIADTHPDNDASTFTREIVYSATETNKVLNLQVGPPSSTNRIYDVSWSTNLPANLWNRFNYNQRGRSDGAALTLSVTNDRNHTYYRTHVTVP